MNKQDYWDRVLHGMMVGGIICAVMYFILN